MSSSEARNAVPFDPVERPAHYNQHPSGVEVCEVTDGLDFNLGNAFKYLARAAHKGATKQDIGKALWYVRRRKKYLQADVVLRAGDVDDARVKFVEGEPDPRLQTIFDMLTEVSASDEQEVSRCEFVEAHLQAILAELG